jgi:redox-sensitive bicupin YhaK (pirin superfamily)
MCAGKGIIHAEMPVHAEGLPDPRGLQLWVDLPKHYKMVEPSYQELGPDQSVSYYSQVLTALLIYIGSLLLTLKARMVPSKSKLSAERASELNPQSDLWVVAGIST